MSGMHDNVLSFTSPTQSKISFIYRDHRITDGQEWGGVAVNGGNIIIKAGRHKSVEPAVWFNSIVEKNYKHMIHTVGGENIPEELNFAVLGTLTIDDISFEVCIGQGSRDSTDENNWHIASRSLWADSDAKNGMIGIKVMQSGTHEFVLTKLD